MGNWMRMFIVIFVVFPYCEFGIAQHKRLSREQYITMYKDIAIREMKRSGIPASITLAQGILESGDGNSTLARKANNHFGIKCHNDWKGKKVYHDDDAKNECFRKYRNADESFVDHSDFLMYRSRYRFLFDLDPADYKGWARGLKKAGYATSPTYARKLIRIIEENQLYKYDDHDLMVKNQPRIETGQALESKQRKIYENNRIKYVIAKPGDSFWSLAEELGKFPGELAKYNEKGTTDHLKEGEPVYLQPKRNKAAHGIEYHTVKEGETMYLISQKYGIKLHKLYQKNQMEEEMEPKPGQKLWLRKKKGGGGFFDFLKPGKDQKIDKEIEKDEPDYEIEFDG